MLSVGAADSARDEWTSFPTTTIRQFLPGWYSTEIWERFHTFIYLSCSIWKFMLFPLMGSWVSTLILRTRFLGVFIQNNRKRHSHYDYLCKKLNFSPSTTKLHSDPGSSCIGIYGIFESVWNYLLKLHKHAALGQGFRPTKDALKIIVYGEHYQTDGYLKFPSGFFR